jgi:hypothetical protein
MTKERTTTKLGQPLTLEGWPVPRPTSPALHPWSSLQFIWSIFLCEAQYICTHWKNPFENKWNHAKWLLLVLTWKIDSHNSFRGSSVGAGNLVIGTPCQLSCCRMWHSKMMRTWFFMSCSWRILFQNFKIYSILLLCGKKYLSKATTSYPWLKTLLHICYLLLCWVLSSFVTLEKNLSCSYDQDHVHSTYMCCFYTRSTQKHATHFH